MGKKRTPTEDTHDIEVSLRLNKAQAITLAAMIAEGYHRGAVNCLPLPATEQDIAVFNHYALGMLSLGKKLVDHANHLK